MNQKGAATKGYLDILNNLVDDEEIGSVSIFFGDPEDRSSRDTSFVIEGNPFYSRPTEKKEIKHQEEEKKPDNMNIVPIEPSLEQQSQPEMYDPETLVCECGQRFKSD